MKKMLEVLVLFSILLVLVSCSGVGGGSSGGLRIPEGAPTVVINDTLAMFAASLDVNLIMDFNTKNNTAVYRVFVNNIDFYENYYEFALNGSFENGMLSFNGEGSIAITEAAIIRA